LYGALKVFYENAMNLRISACLAAALMMGATATGWTQSPPRILPERKPVAPAMADAPPRPQGRILPERKPDPPGRGGATVREPSIPAARIAARAEPPHLSARERELFGQALQAAGSSRWPSARETVARTDNPLLLKVVQWLALRTPGAVLDFSTRAAFIEANPDWPSMGEIRRITEDVADDSGPDERLRWFAKHEPVTTAGKVAYADAVLAMGDLPKAEMLARAAWVAGRFDTSEEREFLNRFGRFIRPEDHRARLEELLYAEQRTAAERMLSRGDPPLAAIGAARSALIAEAGNVERLIQRLPAAALNDPGLIYDRIKWRRSRGREDEARALLPATPDRAPRPDLWWRERQLLAREAISKGLHKEAYVIVQNHGALDPVSISEAEWLAGWLALRFLKDPEAALRHFQKVYDTVQLAANTSRGAYWTGRAAEAAGRADIAADWYRKAAVHITTFYGQLALGRLTDATLPQLPLDPTPSPAERDAFEAKDLTKASRALGDVAGVPHLRAFLLALADSSDFAVDRHMAAELADGLGRPDLGVWIARQAGRDRIIIVKHGYPVPNFAMPNAPERALQLAIMRQESNFDPAAQSPAGAMGLMQLMPATARAMARATKQTYNKNRLKSDPAYNVRLGSVYLADLVGDFDGSYIMAAAGYNAGPGRARQWANTYGDPRAPDVDAVDWIESIPFSETRNYVQRVMENVMVYRAILGNTLSVPQTLEKELKVASQK
jgi:soluble lytic murein transglycosylase